MTYHAMAGLGMCFIGLSLFGLFMLWRKKLFTSRWLLWVFVGSVILPYVANQAGWVATEVGRQPWIVYGLLRTSDAVARSVPGDQVLSSIVLFSFIYVALVILWLVVMNEKIATARTPRPWAACARARRRGGGSAVARLPHRMTGAAEEEE
ncbi:MAG: cytochrome ubiquinol oxidase subunit I [Sandaracinaceae bacterium]